jgi:predicted RNA-binding protein with TRAM domain
LVSQYLDKWPDYPLNEKETYTVTVKKTGDSTTGDLQYSIEVGTETKSEEQ